jgi:hypothetical protein
MAVRCWSPADTGSFGKRFIKTVIAQYQPKRPQGLQTLLAQSYA